MTQWSILGSRLLFATLVAAALPGGADRFDYDEFGRLRSATHSGGATFAYTYDDAGNLVSRTIQPAGPNPFGDVNSNGAADALDIQLVINSALGVDIVFNADLSGDGTVNAVDIQMVVNAVLGLQSK